MCVYLFLTIGPDNMCDTTMPLWNGTLGKNSKSNEGRQAKNDRVKGRDGMAEQLDRETGEEQITVGRTRRKEGGWQTTKVSGIVT